MELKCSVDTRYLRSSMDANNSAACVYCVLLGCCWRIFSSCKSCCCFWLIVVSKLLAGVVWHSLSMSLFCLLMDFFDQLIQKVFCWGHIAGFLGCCKCRRLGSWHVANAGCLTAVVLFRCCNSCWFLAQLCSCDVPIALDLKVCCGLQLGCFISC